MEPVLGHSGLRAPVPPDEEEGAEMDPVAQVEAPCTPRGDPEVDPCCSGSLLQRTPGSEGQGCPQVLG